MADSSMAPGPFYGRHLENAEQHVKTFTLWLATKKLPAPLAAPAVGDPRDIAEIAFFASTLRDGAILWFNAHAIPATMNTLALVKAAFLLHFVFDEANKWRYLGEYFKTKQISTETCDDFIRQVQERGVKCHADDEQVKTIVLNGFLPYIQASVSTTGLENKSISRK